VVVPTGTGIHYKNVLHRGLDSTLLTSLWLFYCVREAKYLHPGAHINDTSTIFQRYIND